MSKVVLRSSAEVGRASVDKLRKYIDSTPIIDIPKNQYKKASRQKICKELGITYSTVGSNANIANLFESLDAKIGVERGTVRQPNSQAIRQLQEQINTLEKRVAALNTETVELRSKLKRYEHFEKTGRLPLP